MKGAELPVSPIVIRGNVSMNNLMSFGGRGGDLAFLSPDPNSFASEVGLGHPEKLKDLYQIGFDEIVDYLAALGERLDIASNPYLQQALKLSYQTAPVTPPILDFQYAGLQAMFTREFVTQLAEHSIGIRYWRTGFPANWIMAGSSGCAPSERGLCILSPVRGRTLPPHRTPLNRCAACANGW